MSCSINSEISNILKRIEEIPEDILKLQQEKKRLKTNLTSAIEKHISTTPVDEAVSLLSETYWKNKKLEMPIRQAFKTIFGLSFSPLPQYLEIPCAGCGDSRRVKCDNRQHVQSYTEGKSHQKRSAFCLKCSAKIKKTEQEERNERDQVYQEQVQMLREMSYSEYLKTDHWNRIRKEAYAIAGYHCALCNSKGKLHAHHKTYENRGNWWLERHDIIVLCESCHQKHHGRGKR